MTRRDTRYGATLLPTPVLAHSRNRTVADYERELTQRRCTEARLRATLIRAEALLRSQKQLIQRQAASIPEFRRREAATVRIASLTPRQHQIMELVLAGYPSKKIAADLGISQRTVESHRASIMKKTGSRSLPALTRLALGAAWTTDQEQVAQPSRKPTLVAA